MKSEENQTIEPMDIQNIVKDVKTIKTMILRARYTAAKMANAEMLKLYFATGAYAMKRTREGQWGTGVIARIFASEYPKYAAVLQRMGSLADGQSRGGRDLPDSVYRIGEKWG